MTFSRLAVALALLLAAGCIKKEAFLVCEACIEKEGAMYCGRSAVNLEKEKQTHDQGKIEAGKAACVNFAARKGGGYVGSVFQDFKKQCEVAVKTADLRRARCSEEVVASDWHPKDGI